VSTIQKNERERKRGVTPWSGFRVAETKSKNGKSELVSRERVYNGLTLEITG
jgi:hypothetical protein